MGIAPYMVSTSLIGVIAQRLVKVLCPSCKRARMAEPDELALMKVNVPVQIYDAVGCRDCNNTGYKGRTAIHEIIHCTSGISTLIANGAGKEEIENAARQHGTRLLRDNISELVQQGVTSIDELVRVTYSV
jgi:type IV pilus assembly protein PilB